MRPFLKWAGGKYNLLSIIKNALPNANRLIEPFVGAGSVFLNTNYSEYLLADANQDIIRLYQCFQQQGRAFINQCQQYFSGEHNNPDAYYKFRDKFNNTHEIKERSALFLYLNRHGYNGLCRYNASGIFNVPFGKYKSPFFPLDRMEYFHQKSQQASFIHSDFIETMRQAKKGDVIYCDPPYVPLSKTAFFTAYSPLCFDEDKQIQLAEEANKAAKRGIPVVISNHDTEFTRKLYQGSSIISFKVQRLISSDISNRNKVNELLAIFK